MRIVLCLNLFRLSDRLCKQEKVGVLERTPGGLQHELVASRIPDHLRPPW